MRRAPVSPPALLFILLLAHTAPHRLLAAGISADFDSCGVRDVAGPTQFTNFNFHPYKISAFRSALANRDLEFHWSDSYSSLFGRPLDAPRAGTTDSDLDLLGLTICSTPNTGAFGFPVPYIRLMYDYFRFPTASFGRSDVEYNPNPAVTLGFTVPQPSYGDLDRNHADTYIFAPRFSGDPLYQGGGEYYGDGGDANTAPPHAQWPSPFIDADEDVSSGHPAFIDTATAYRMNSVGLRGPRPSLVGGGGSGDWTGPRALAPLVFNHEFQHMINRGTPSSPLTEIFSHAAEALTGEHPETPVFDVPYTWGLLRSGLNYQAYRSFAAYLTYGFRGADTTFAGRSDGLVWRWARGASQSLVGGLGEQLTDANCPECATKSYFSGLSALDRVNLVVHHWRVANYVNKPALAEGQYGFPPQFGFEPNVDVGNWQNIDPAAYDSVNIELEVKLDGSHLTREVSFAGTATGILNPANAHAVALAPFGSDYWVVRSDPTLWSGNRDLVVRLMPEGRCGVRLMASAIAYSEQSLPGGEPDSLWNHPEWAQLAVAPRWIDLATAVDPDPLEIVIPDFGLTHKAALVVVTAGSSFDQGGDTYWLPYRMNLALRTSPYQSPNPKQVTTLAAPYAAWLPSWSPTGDEVAFDPPRGSGRWVWEAAWQPLQCGDPGGASYQRLALRSAPEATSETIFSRPTSHLRSPRWSWDGTRVAFSSSRPNPVIPSNVFVGHVGYNHAPSFTGLGDQGLTQGVGFQLTLSASDPDGEGVTYEAPAVFLPPGASFDPGTRTFLWPDPQPAGAEYYVVFRALDPSGGVAHRVIRYTVQSPGGGCPFLDTRTTAGWQEENSVLARSLTGSLALDGYRLRFTPELDDGRIALRLRENEQEYTTLDQVRLVAVDHAPDVRAYALGDRVFLATRVPAYRVTTASGRDITAFVSGSGGYHWGFPGDTLFVEMTARAPRGTFGATATLDGDGGEGGLEGDPKEMEVVYDGFGARRASPAGAGAVDAAVLGSTGIRVEVPDGGGGWRTLTHYYPRRYRDEAVLDSLGAGPCRLIFVGRHRLHFIGRYLRAENAATPQPLTLLEARHSRLGDVKGAVNREAGTTTLLTPGDTLGLEFAATPTPVGQVRDHFLLATGLYSSSAPIVRGSGAESEGVPLPTRFALAQNRPNPFTRTTAIHFELPVEAVVRLEVFDLQGRSVALLAQGVFPAGFHELGWDRRDARGTPARPGVYLYRLTAGDFRQTRKLLLAR